MPLNFLNKKDFEIIEQGDIIEIEKFLNKIDSDEFTVNVINKGEVKVKNDLSVHERELIKYGGLINMIKDKN